MGEDVNNSFTEGQKNMIYTEILVPLKLQISQILLYDTKAALEFLQKYNEIVENEDSLGNDIFKRITELEFEIQDYIRETGKEKVFEERCKAVLQKIEDLRINSIQLSLEEFEIKFAEIKKSYEEVSGNYSFQDREKIEREIYALQANLIMREVAEGKSADEIQEKITENDKAGLNMFVIEKINALSQKDGLKDIATKVNNIVMTDEDAVLSTELWMWLNAAEKGIKCKEQLQTSQPSTEMIVASPKRNITFWDNISRLFSKEPIFPLQARDLRKINIQWLSAYIPKSMLLELEEHRLSEEDRQVDNRYVPDSRAVIYRVLRNIMSMIGNWSKEEYELINENGSKLLVEIMQNDRYYEYNTRVTIKVGDVVKVGQKISIPVDGVHAFNEMTKYARLLDEVFNTDFQQQLLQEAKDIYIDKKHKRSPVYDNLMLSLNKMLKEYDCTKLDFEATEEAKRKQFYEKNRFKEQLKKQDIDNSIKSDVEDVKTHTTQDKTYNDEGKEQET